MEKVLRLGGGTQEHQGWLQPHIGGQDGLTHRSLKI